MRRSVTLDTGDSQVSSIVVIEPSRQMQLLLRAMLLSYGIRSVRMFADTERASSSILNDPPRLVLLDWEAGPNSGANFLKLIRHKNMYPVCLVPIIVMFSEARRCWVEKALRLGGQGVLVKPMSPAALLDRIKWVLNGASTLSLRGDRYVIEGMDVRLEDERDKQEQLKTVREYEKSQLAELANIQNDIDKILHSSF